MSAARALVADMRRCGALHASWCFDATDPQAARAGRARIRLLLELWGLGGRVDLVGDLELIVSELITNVYEHANTPDGMAALIWEEGVVTVWVGDRGSGTPCPLPAPKPERSEKGSGWDWTGWGLAMVEAIAAEAGGSVLVRPDPGGCGKSVGVRIPVNQSGSA